MKKISKMILATCIILSANITVFAEPVDHSKIEYISDLRILREVLEKNHGNLYESVKKETLDNLFKKAEDTITEDMTLQQFYTELGKVMSSINDGHTHLDPTNYEEFIKKEKVYLPLKVKSIDGKMYSDYINQYVPLGSEILEINDKKVSDVLDKLKYCTGNESSDPLAFSYSIIEKKLSYLYPQFIEYKKEHKIKFKNPKNNEIKTVVIKSENIDIDMLDKYAYSNYMSNSYMSAKEALNVKFDLETSTATLRIYSFAPKDVSEFKKYVDKFFEDVAFKNIKNVIFDVRNNLGGSEALLKYVLSYAYDEDFYSSKGLLLKNPGLARIDLLSEEDRKNFNSETFKLVEGDEEKEKVQVLDDGSYYMKSDKIKHVDKNNFNGNIYTLANGGSFSSGSIFAQKIKEVKNSYLVGTEASGNYYETTAGFIPIWELPNTKIKYSVPLMHNVINDKPVNGIPRNAGVKPDYEVKVNYNDYIKGIDTQLKFVQDLIKKDNL